MSAKLSKDDFVRKSRNAHGDRYGYEKAVYQNNATCVTIICPDHGEFQQRPVNHMSGRGCPRCKADATSARCTDDAAAFIEKAVAIHGNLYDYSRVKYTRSNAKVEIVCKTHGSFWQPPNAHISGMSGCPRCAGKRRGTADFIEDARAVHGEKFSYDKTVYSNVKLPVTITCSKHGDFLQTPDNHLVGRGCRFCWWESNTSKPENDLAEWLTSLGLEIERQNRDVLGKLEIDIWIPSARVGIEFNGSYWHSHCVQKNKRVHEHKQTAASLAGARLITVWEFDWLDRRAIVEEMILRALGMSRAPVVGARKCALRKASAAEASAFYAKHHIQGPCRGAVDNRVLEVAGEIVAAMSFTAGGTRRGKAGDGEYELARYATSCRVPGGASRLFFSFLADHSPRVIWSFSDDQHFSGAMYRTLGFVVDGKINADYKIINPKDRKIWHKSLWQRKLIQDRLTELGIEESFDPGTDPRTEAEMHDAARVWRIYDAGKTRWVWRS